MTLQVYESGNDSMMVVKAYDQKGQQVGQGSGVMLLSGDIITYFPVVKKGGRYTVGPGKRRLPALLPVALETLENRLKEGRILLFTI